MSAQNTMSSPFVSTEVMKERLEKCVECEFVIKSKSTNISNPTDAKGIYDWFFGLQCKICRCGMRPKAQFSFTRCPRLKWKR